MSDDAKTAAEPKALDQQSVNQTTEEKQAAQAANEYSKVEAGGKLSMHVKVYSPYKEYFDGQAFSISAVNATGPFDILPKHHNFISLLLPCDVVVRSVELGDRKIRISGGLIHVKADRVIVFLDV